MFSKTIRLTALFLFCAVLSLSAQTRNFTLALKLVEDPSGNPVQFATVSLTPKGATTASKYVLSDDKGAAKIEKIRKGTYTVKAELLGYVAYSSEVTFDEQAAVDLGSIKMALDVHTLESATVTDVGNPIIVKKDTVEYQASSFKTSDNDMNEFREPLLHSDRGTASSDVACERQQFLDVNQFAALVPGYLCCLLQVYFTFTRHDAYEMAVPVAFQDDGLEYAVDVFSELLGYMCGGKVFFVHDVWYGFIFYACLVQQSGCIGLGNVWHVYFLFIA
jgi:hypothetical protein